MKAWSVMRYRCYFLDMHSTIARVEVIEAETDAEALEPAAIALRAQGDSFSGVEVWDRGRRIERAQGEGLEQIRRWRMKAEELRTAAESFTNDSARRAFRSSAETYDALANALEARLRRQGGSGQAAG
jgi:hypothetical protein